MADEEIKMDNNIHSDDIGTETPQQNTPQIPPEMSETTDTSYLAYLDMQKLYQGSPIDKVLENETLSLEYPKYAGKIKELLRKGRDPEELRKKFVAAELGMSTQYSHDEINEFFERTPGTVSQLIEKMRAKTDEAYVKIMEREMPADRVREITWTAHELAKKGGMVFSIPMLLKNPELLEEAEKAAKEVAPEKGFLGRTVANVRNMLSSKQSSNVSRYNRDAARVRQRLENTDYLLSRGREIWLNEQKAQQLYKADKAHREGRGIGFTPSNPRRPGANLTFPPDEELMELARKEAEREIKSLEEAAKIDAKDAQEWYTPVRTPDPSTNYWSNIASNAIESSAFTAETMISSGLAYTLGNIIVPGGGFGAGLAHLFSIIASIKEADSEGAEAFENAIAKGLSEKEALKAADNAFIANAAFLPMSNYFSNKLFGSLDDTFFEPSGLRILGDVMKTPSLARKAAAHFAADVLPSVIDSFGEGFEEVVQYIIGNTVLGEKVNGWEVADAFKRGAMSAAFFGLGRTEFDNILYDSPHMQRFYQQRQKLKEQIVQKIAPEVFEAVKLGRDIQEGKIQENDIVEEKPVVFIPKSKIDEATAQALNIQDEIIEDENGNVNQAPQSEQQEEENQEQEDEEIAIRKDTWDSFAAENPEQAEALKDFVREGTQGVTAREKAEQTAENIISVINENPELKAETERLADEYAAAGRSETEAQALAQTAGFVANAMDKQYGISIEQGMNLTAVKGGNQNGQQANNSQNIARVRTMKGTELDVRYKVVEANDLITSNNDTGAINPNYLQELQPRQRDRESSLQQIQRIASNIDPELLGESRLASDGAPIVGSDMMVESGNGRIMALRQAYKNGWAERYREWLKSNAGRFGLDASEIESLNNPVLIRERISDIDRKSFVAEANESSISQMSATEHAVNDAQNITDAMLALYSMAKELKNNYAFIQEFSKLIPQNEKGSFYQQNGAISKAGLERVQNALIAKAYNDNNILNRLNEFTEDSIKNISNALIQAAPRIAIFENSGHNDLSIRDDIASAVNTLASLKSEGLSIEDYLSQIGMFEEDKISDTARELLLFFEKNKRSAKKITAGLINYAELAMQQPQEAQSVLFSDIVQSKEDLLANAIENAENGNQLDLGFEGYNQIGVKRKNEMEAALKKNRPDMTEEQRAEAISEIEKLGESVKDGGNPKVEKAATKWLLGGHIILPEDNYKILDAIRICEQEHIDPMSVSDPNEILAKYTIKETKAEKRINPDTVPEFSDKAYCDNGIIVYTVDDSKNGQKAVRNIIDTHWGEDANPWCLAARGTDGTLKNAWRMWEHYNKINKRIAFQNGKLLAFCATDNENKKAEWWDREDKSSEGIPYTVRENGKNIKRFYVEDKKPVKKYHENGKLKYERLPNGETYEYFSNGVLSEETHPDGTIRKYTNNKLPDNERLYYEKFHDGTERKYYSGEQKIEYEYIPNVHERRYYVDGKIEEETVFVGEGETIFRTYRRNGTMEYEKLPDGSEHDYYENGQLKREKLSDKSERNYYESGQLKSEYFPDGSWRKYNEQGELVKEKAARKQKTEEELLREINDRYNNWWDNYDPPEESHYQADQNKQGGQVNARTSWAKGTSSAETQSLVEFFTNANASTGFHELAHHVLRVMTDAAQLENASDILLRDVETVFRNAGVSREDFYNNVGNARETAQEYFAKSFEAYLHKGKAPTKELQGAFDRIRNWLVEVYHNIRESLGIELNEEMQDIFDRLLATPEQLAEQKSVSDINALYDAAESEIQRLNEEINSLESQFNSYKEEWNSQDWVTELAYKQGKKEGRERQKNFDRASLEKRIAKLKENQKLMQERQKERAEIRKKSDKLIKAINRMAKAENISWKYQEKIRNLLDTHDKIIKKNYSLQDLQFIHSQVKEFYDIGKRERAEQKLIDKERIDGLRQGLRATMQEDWDNRPKGVPTKPEDAQKQYKGVRGTASKILDWSMAKTFSAQRFFDYMNGSKFKKYKGPWTKFFVDRPNEAMNEKLMNVYRRQKSMEDKMRELNIDAKTLAETRDVSFAKKDGKKWTVEELIGIYAGLKNDKSGEAILFGNFAHAESYEQAQAWADEAGAALNENEKALGDFIIEEYEQHFDRLNDFSIKYFNRGLNHEENYTPVRRLEVTTSNAGMVNPDAADAELNPASLFGNGMNRVERGFMQSRVDFKQNKQPGIDLRIVNMWNNQVEIQEHAMAFYPLVRDLRRVLLSKNKEDDATIRQMIKETRGKYAWEMIQQYFNIIATNDTRQAYNTLDDITRYLSKNMSVAYLCGNLGTALKQWNSFFFAAPYASPQYVFNAIGAFLKDRNGFLEECYRLDPQLKARNGDPFLQELRKGEGVIYDNLIKWASTPIGWCDRAASSIVFKAVYDANIRNGLSQNDAIKEAHRVVELTQPPAHAKNKPLIWQQHGYARLAMMFTNSLANIYGITLYDLTTAIKRGEFPTALATVVGLTLAAMMIKGLSSGSDDDDEPWLQWGAEAVAEQTINSIPLIGKELMTLWDYKKGFFKENNSAFVAPLAKMIKGARSWEKKGGNERAVWDIIEGGSLLYPFPVTGLHRLYEAVKYLGEGEAMNVLRRMFGVKVEKDKIKKAVSF